MFHCVPSSRVSGMHVAEVCPRVPSKTPEVWGPSGWFMMHVMAANYPNEPSSEYRTACSDFLQSLPYMLPCGECGKHLQEYVQNIDIPKSCASKDSLHEFVNAVHDSVNQRKGKALGRQPTDQWDRIPLCPQ